MENNIEKAKEILKKYEQNNILEFMENIEVSKQNKLANQILNIDFDKMKELYNKTKEKMYTDIKEILPITAINPDKIPEEKKKEYLNYGEKAIKSNKFAVTTMAGGQGTRLRTL